MIVDIKSSPSERASTALPGGALFVLFTLSGFVGILAEQVFEKMLSVVVGGATPAAAVVISVYFIGLSAGGWLASSILKRSRASSLRLYGLCELGVAACCLVMWLTFTQLVPWYAPLLAACGSGSVCLTMARFAIASTIVLPTAIGLGLSFPFLSDLASSETVPAHYLAKLYFVNLLGAALCALLAPYLIFPWIGLSGAILIAIGVDVAVGFGAMSLAKDVSGRSAVVAGTARISRRMAGRDRLTLGVAFLSGLVFFSLEVIWTHLAGVVAGTSVYAFSSMLFIVLLGLALGSFKVAADARKGKPAPKIGALFFLSASVLLIQVVWWQYIPASISLIGSFARGFYTGELARLLSLVAVLLPFTYTYGMIYPCLFHERRFASDGAGQMAGYMGFANAIGCVLGAGLGFFVLIPGLGAEASLRLFTVVLTLCGALMLRLEGDAKNFKPSLISAAMLSGLAFLFPSWDRAILTSGANVYFGKIVKAQPGAAPAAATASGKEEPKPIPPRLIFFHEDAYGGMTTIKETHEDGRTLKILLTNGKFQGDDGQQTSAQTAFTLIPTLHLRHRNNALMIGCGTGQSAGVLDAVGFDQVGLAELSPGILQAAGAHFSHINQGVLGSPRARVYLEDGRNVLLRRPDTYDLIAIELTSVWFAGATNIYSHEFYELARTRLRKGGILQQWLQLHHISPREVESIIGTVWKTFPHVSLWLYGGQGIILGSMDPIRIEEEAKEQVLAYLAQRFGAAAAPGRLDEIVSSRLIDDQQVNALLTAHPPVINTDWNRWIEFSTPRYNITDDDWPGINIANLRSVSR